MTQEQKTLLYAARWNALKIKALNTNNKIDSMSDSLIEILSSLLEEPVPEEAKMPEPIRTGPSDVRRDNTNYVAVGEKSLWYSNAHILKVVKSAKGEYPKKYPEGLVVHFTAGRYKDGIKNAIDSIKSSPYFYMAMGTDGKVVQANPLNQWGHHAGQSSWIIEGKKVDGVSNRLVGLEMCNPGRLDKVNGEYFTWFDKKNPIPSKEVRVISADDDNIQKGFYVPYTKEQEQGLIDFCMWLKLNNPNVFNFDYVLGHDEVAGKKGIGFSRKNDPGGALSMNMTEFRELLKKEYAKIKK
jgi:N-acetyl-anhydromuramyl-L-alanine amidase AmpD